MKDLMNQDNIDKKKERLFLDAIKLYHQCLRLTHDKKGDAGVIFTMCISMCMEHLADEEDVRHGLNLIGENCLYMWRDMQNLRKKYNIHDIALGYSEGDRQ